MGQLAVRFDADEHLNTLLHGEVNKNMAGVSVSSWALTILCTLWQSCKRVLPYMTSSMHL